MTGTWDNVATIIKQQGSCAVVTVVELFGSGPREMGARLIVAPDGAFSGTIGGGTLEWQALAAAQAMLPATSPGMSERKYGLGPDLGQCCGGYVTLCYEIFLKRDFSFSKRTAKEEARGPVWVRTQIIDGQFKRDIVDMRPGLETSVEYVAGQSLLAKYGQALTPVCIFGAGHVGKALIGILKTLPLRVTWLDSREIDIEQSLPANVDYRNPHTPGAEIA
jgi:xanthine dehydrogenase accessory factor